MDITTSGHPPPAGYHTSFLKPGDALRDVPVYLARVNQSLQAP